MSNKVTSAHLARKAVIYLRQSSFKQVHENRESTSRQYALRARALQLGWSEDAVEVVDEDLGRSSLKERGGLQRLAEDIAHGRVGGLFALEVSRLARSSADWYRLLDLAGLADVVIGDEDALYDPRDGNDRLLLGLKGQFAEAELQWMRLRLRGGILSKARRGELRFPAATGYVWDDAGRLRLDPDEHVQQAVRLIFERLHLDGGVRAVVRYFARNKLQMPLRDAFTGELRWTPPRYQWVLSVLHNPVYAGVYAFGKSEQRQTLVDGVVRRRRVVALPAEAWKVCLRDHHPAYVSWEEFMAIQEKIRSNRPRRSYQQMDRHGAVREGEALLQGLVLCGRCGYRMFTRYFADERRAQYECRQSKVKDGTLSRCWSVSAVRIDAAISELFLQVVQPAEIDLSLAVARDAERQGEEIRRQWQLRLERARYEVRLAERRYKAVDPDLRTAARTLEREWNDRMEELARLERDYESVRDREKVVLSDDDRRQILALARDLPRVWNAPTTTTKDKKNLLRMVIREVSLSPIDVPRRLTRMQVLWVTGTVTELQVPRSAPGQAMRTPDASVQVIRELYLQSQTDDEIAVMLNQRHVSSSSGKPWTAATVRCIRSKNGMPKVRGARARREGVVLRREDGLYSSAGVAKLLHITLQMVHGWVRRGHLAPAVGGRRRPAWYRIDSKELDRLHKLRESFARRGYGPGGRHAHHEARQEV